MSLSVGGGLFRVRLSTKRKARYGIGPWWFRFWFGGAPRRRQPRGRRSR